MAKQGPQLRFLLLLVLLAGVGYVAWPYVGGRAKKQSTALAQIQKLGGSFDIRRDERRAPGEPDAPPPRLSEEVLGVDTLAEVIVVQLNGTEVTDQQLGEILTDLPGVEYLSLNNTSIGDAGTLALGTLKLLKSLSLTNTPITDETLVYVGMCAELESLQLTGTQITDAGLAELVSLTELKRLWIDGTQVSDAGLEHLSAMLKLERVYLKDSKVTPAGVEKLKGKMPMLTID